MGPRRPYVYFHVGINFGASSRRHATTIIQQYNTVTTTSDWNWSNGYESKCN